MIRKAGIISTDFESVEKTQTSCQKEERFTVQNKVTDASPIRERTRKTKLFIRHKPLYANKNGPLCKTRTREGAIETALRFVEKRKNLRSRPGHQFLTRIIDPLMELFASCSV